MLIISSDLHLKDGTSGKSITVDEFRVFAERLGSVAYQASRRADGRYDPINVIDLVFVGDVFDLIRSERWLLGPTGKPETIRPWNDPQGDRFIHKIQSIVTAIIKHNQAGLSIFKKMSQGKIIQLPPATRSGQPDLKTSERISVPVRIHYMVGNHDWFLHLPGHDYDQIRKQIIEAMGLFNSDKPFPYEMKESYPLQEIARRYQVCARHGDMFDAMNYDKEAGRNVSTLGDAMTVELLTRFPYEVYRYVGADLSPKLSEGLKELSNVRPAIVTPLWLGNLTNNYASDPQHADVIKKIWDQCAEDFLNLDFVQSHDKRFTFDTVDALEAALLFSRGLSLDALNSLAVWLNQKFMGNEKISISEHALEEDALKQGLARYVVYGHTHFHEVVPLDSYMQAGKLLNQVYFNAGTWHHYHNLTLQEPTKFKFVGLHVMTYLAFFEDGERGGRQFEAWSGSLSIPARPRGAPGDQG